MTIKREFKLFYLIILVVCAAFFGMIPYSFLSNHFGLLLSLVEQKLGFNSAKFELLKLWLVVTFLTVMVVALTASFSINIGAFKSKILKYQCPIIVVFSVFLVRNLVLSYLLPISYDEAFSYLYNVSKGPIISYLYYPGPNNHILFTTLSSFFSFIDAPLFVMRGMNIVLSPLFYVLLFIVVYEKINQKTAWLFVSLLFLNSSLACYSIVGRGYLFLTIFSTLLFLFRKSRWFFVIVSMCGFLTSPVFLFPFVTVLFYELLTAKRVDLWALIVSFLSTLYFYLPVFIVNGWQAVINNSWVQAQGNQTYFRDLIEWLYGLMDWLFVLPYGLFVLLVSIVWVVLQVKKELVFSNYLRLVFAALVSVLMICIIKQVIPPVRVFVYLIPLILFPVSLFLSRSIKWVIVPLVCYAFWNGQSFYHTMQLTQHNHTEYKKVAELCRNDKEVLSTSDTYKVMTAFYLFDDGFEPKLKAMNNPHKALILDKHLDHAHKSQNYKVIYENEEILYLRKYD